MKILVASDLHGSAYYCEKLMARYNDEKPDRILLLGDILYHGPRNDLPRDYNPKACIQMLNEHKNEIMCCRGNCDCEVDQMVLQFPITADYFYMPIGKQMFFVTHGHIFNKNNMPPIQDDDIILHGHTHVPTFEKLEHGFYANPGSTSIPKENSHYSYMVITDDEIMWKTMDGETYKTVKLPL